MPDSTPSRPRLVSVGDGGEPEAPPTPAEATDSAAPTVPRRLLWLVLALAGFAAVGWILQTQNVHSLEARNATLAGELFTARSALEAYENRFVEVRESVDGLQAQLDQLNSLVSDDPVTFEPTSPPPAGSTPTVD